MQNIQLKIRVNKHKRAQYLSETKKQIFSTVNNTAFRLTDETKISLPLSLYPWSSVQQWTIYSAH